MPNRIAVFARTERLHVGVVVVPSWFISGFFFINSTEPNGLERVAGR